MGLYPSSSVTAHTVLDALRLHGATFTLEEDRVRVMARKGLPAPLVAPLREHRDEIKALLRRQESAHDMEPQLARGADILRQMELSGQVGTPHYENTRLYYIALLCKYELLSEGKPA